MKSSKTRRVRTADPPPAFSDVEEAFFAAGVEASETGQFDTITDETEAPRPGLLKRFLSRVQRA